MVFAKTSKCLRLSEQIRSGRVRKGYCAIVSVISKRSDTLISYLIKDENMNMVRVLDNEVLTANLLSFHMKSKDTQPEMTKSIAYFKLS